MTSLNEFEWCGCFFKTPNRNQFDRRGAVLDEFERRDWGLISMNLNDVVLLLSLCCFISRFNLAFG